MIPTWDAVGEVMNQGSMGRFHIPIDTRFDVKIQVTHATGRVIGVETREGNHLAVFADCGIDCPNYAF